VTGLSQSVLPTLGGLLLGAAGVGAFLRGRFTPPRNLQDDFFESSPVPMWICDMQTLAFLAVNNAAVARYGFSREEFLAMDLTQIRPIEDVPALREALRLNPNTARSIVSRHRTKSGRLLRVMISSNEVQYAGRHARLVFAIDTTAQALAEEQLRENQAALELAQKVAHLGSYVYDYASGRTTWSDELYRTLGTTRENCSADALWSFDHPEDRMRVREAIARARDERLEYDIDHRIVRPDGTVRYVQERGYSTYDDSGKPLRNFGTVLDITDRKSAETALSHLAYHDQLTSLDNRAGLVDRLGRILKERHAAGLTALFFLDLDRFKSVNDTLGHAVGDSLILEVARRLQRQLRTDELLARSGGDEFVVVAPALQDREHISNLARDLLDTLAAPFTIAGREYTVAASIGISVYPLDARDPDGLLRNADVALYAAKKRGGATFQYYTADLQRTAARRFQLESALRRAIEQCEFTLHYQPVICARTGAVSAVEALVRWTDPELGTVEPSEFIPFAEETGAIRAIGAWVFERVLVQAKRWERAGRPLRVWVNVSATQLKDPTLPIVVRDLLRRYDVKGSLIGLELTESAFIDTDETILSALHRIKALGVTLALDDFGVKYSSLEYLQRLPVDVVKIDRAFVEGLVGNRFNASIVRAVVGVAHDIGFKVTAEGVEAPDQLAILQGLGCDMWQGFLFSPALPADAVDTLLQEKSAYTTA
jgi:diguanylate cyclase (GGDEF)-like protein/PAS domain S-box-containing protein